MRLHRGQTSSIWVEGLEPRRLLAGDGLSGAYYDNPDLTNLKLTRIDSEINFQWGTSSPDPSIANTHYSVSWTGAVQATRSEMHTFFVRSDDGVRLWVDNQLIINNWVGQAPTEFSGQIALRAGQKYAIKLEYYQGTGGSAAELRWSSPSMPKQLISQSQLFSTLGVDNRGSILQEVWTNVNGGTIANLTGNASYPIRPSFRQLLTTLEVYQSDWADSHGSRVRGYLVPKFSGNYTFAVAGNDNVELWLSTDANPNNKTRLAYTQGPTGVREWGKFSTQTSTPLTLLAGQRYYIEVLHKEWGGFDHWSVAWITPRSSTLTVIDGSTLEPFGTETPMPATGTLDNASTSRNRILITPQMVARAKVLVSAGGEFQATYDAVKASANTFLTEPLPPTSAPAVGTQATLAGLEDNLNFLAGVYVLVGAIEGMASAQPYVDKAKAIIANIIQWSTWDSGNQFLGAGMVSAGISVCYDAMYDQFTPTERKGIADALYLKAIKPATDTANARNYWSQWFGNWSFVSLGGPGLAALSIAPEYYKVETEAFLRVAYPVIRSSMIHFDAENGGWHEGPGYQGYGGLYLIRFMSAMWSSLGTDYGLSNESNFQGYANFLLYGSTTVNNNTNNTFPFNDGDWSQNGDPFHYWLATRFNRPDIAQVVHDRVAQTPWALFWHDARGVSPGASAQRNDYAFLGNDRLLQWGTSGQRAYSEQLNIWRDTWNSDSTSLAFKGGFKGIDLHDQLDGGNFILDALGTRWARDTSRDDYSLPQVGGTNYGVYRKRAEGQNTLVINPTNNDYLSSADANERVLNADQVYKGDAYATVKRSLSTAAESIAVMDLSSLYSKMRVSTVQRGFRLDRDDGSVLVQDEITSPASPEIYWFMHIPVPWAEAASRVSILDGGKTAIISNGTNRLWCRILSGTGATFSVTQAVPLASSPVVPGQASNSGTSKLTIRFNGSTNERLAVWMVPLKQGQLAPTQIPAVTSLATWTPRKAFEAWAGDIDAYLPGDTSDTPGVEPSWQSQIAAVTQRPVKGFDDSTTNRVVAATLNLEIPGGHEITRARLTVALKSDSPTTSDLLYLDSTTGQTYASLGWGTIASDPVAKELILTPTQVQQLQDGRLNLAIAGNAAVDWLSLDYQTAQIPPVPVSVTTTDAGDQLRVIRNGSIAQLFRAGETTPLAQWNPLAVPSVSINTAGGDDTLEIDYTGGDPLPDVGLSFNGGLGTDTIIIRDRDGDDAISIVSTAISIGTRTINTLGAEIAKLHAGQGNDSLSSSSPSFSTVSLVVAGSGRLIVASGTALPTDTDVQLTGTLDLGGVNTVIDALDGAGIVTNSGVSAQLTLGAANGSGAFDGPIRDGVGMVTVEKIGSGLIVLSGVSVYSGSTRIIGGAIRVASDGALGSTAGGTIIRGGTNSGRLELIGDVTVGDVLTLEARGGAIPAHVVSIAGSNAITNSIRTVSGGLGYGLQTDNGTLSIAGNIEQITPQTYDRPLYLRGSGTAAIAGYIRGNGGFDLNLIKSDAGTWSIAGDIAIASIAVDAGTLKLDTPVRRVMAVSGVSITGTGVLDVTRNVLEIAYTGVSPFASLYPAVVNGNRAGGSGGAPRIIQSTGVAYRTVGMYDSGVSIRVGYAAIGDGNMNGAVTRVDLDFLTRAGFRGAPMAGTQWTTGDWNYNGFTTSTDLNLLTASGMFNTGFYQ